MPQFISKFSHNYGKGWNSVVNLMTIDRSSGLVQTCSYEPHYSILNLSKQRKNNSVISNALIRLNIKKLISLQHRVRATKSHIQYVACGKIGYFLHSVISQGKVVALDR